MIALIAACFVGAFQEEGAEQKKAWDGHVRRLSAKKPLKLLVVAKEKVTDIDAGEVAAFWEAAGKPKVLKGGTCDCRPRPDSQFVLLLDDLSVVTIQIVAKHWFKGTVLVNGHSTDFYFLDPKDGLPELAARLTAPPKSKTMCEKCAGKAYIKMMGTCSACPGVTASAAYKLCLNCAAKKGVCQVCEAPLNKDKARIEAVRADLRVFSDALDQYQMNVGKYPTTDEGLEALLACPASVKDPSKWKGPYLKAVWVPKDPWGNDYVYVYPSERGLKWPDVFCVGVDGRANTEDDIFPEK